MNIDTIKTPRKIGNFTIYNVTPVRGGDSFLFVYDDICFLYDTGYGFCSDLLHENITKVIGDRPLDYILLTHSHYDHCLGSPYLTTVYPDVKVVAFSYAAKIFGKESARSTMRRLDQGAADHFGYERKIDCIDLLHADIIVEDGDEIMLGSHPVRIHLLPGHTRDCIAYYLEEERMLLGTETLGLYAKEGLHIPVFLVSYQMSLDSIEKASKIDMDYYFIPHSGVIEGADIPKFIEDAHNGHIKSKNLIVDSFKKGMTYEEIYAAYEEIYYCEEVRSIYPRTAFAENTNIQIPITLREMGLID